MKNKIKSSGYSKIRQSYFINGKQKFRLVEYMDGIPIQQWYEINVDIITAFQDGYYENLDELNNFYHSKLQPEPKEISDTNELPF